VLWICTRCQRMGEEGDVVCPHCGLIAPEVEIPPRDEPATPLPTPAPVPSVNLDDTETPWERGGLYVGMGLGLLAALWLTSDDPSAGIGSLLCSGVVIGLMGGAFGWSVGIILGAMVRTLRGRNKVDERALETALDRHEEISQPWQPDRAPPSDSASTAITDPGSAEAPSENPPPGDAGP
jgi:hypothetical protein